MSNPAAACTCTSCYIDCRALHTSLSSGAGRYGDLLDIANPMRNASRLDVLSTEYLLPPMCRFAGPHGHHLRFPAPRGPARGRQADGGGAQARRCAVDPGNRNRGLERVHDREGECDWTGAVNAHVERAATSSEEQSLVCDQHFGQKVRAENSGCRRM